MSGESELGIEVLLGTRLRAVGKVLRVEGFDIIDEIIFETMEGGRYRLFHQQDCCEDVWVEDICGDLGDLCGASICLAEEAHSQEGGGGGQRPLLDVLPVGYRQGGSDDPVVRRVYVLQRAGDIPEATSRTPSRLIRGPGSPGPSPPRGGHPRGNGRTSR